MSENRNRSCDADGCVNDAEFAYLWPQRSRLNYQCERHSAQMRAAAASMGFSLHLDPLCEPRESEAD